jgi:hypothetical protein
MACDKCEYIALSSSTNPFIPPNGSRNDMTYLCSCGQAWWQCNDHFHLWQQVDPGTYQAILVDQEFVAEFGYPDQ